MTVRAYRLIPGSQLTNAAATYFTSPAATTTVVKRALFSNTTATTQTITVNVVTSGGSSSVSNQVINARAVAPGETYVSPELAGVVLGAGDFIQALSSANASITFVASGIEIT
jgi:hypothetical protein